MWDQLTEFCGRVPRTRKHFCIPWGSAQDVITAMEEVTSQVPTNTTYVVHVDTNDMQRTISEELLDKYQQMIRTYKDKSNRVIVSGIITYMQADNQPQLTPCQPLQQREHWLCKYLGQSSL